MHRTAHLLLGSVGAAALLVCVQASADHILNHGDFDDFGNDGVVEYLDVTEIEPTSGEELPLFGEPEVDVNDLIFSPTNILSATSDGEDPDRTAADLEFEFDPLPGTGVRKFSIWEDGLYSLFGGTDLTRVLYGVEVRVTVDEVDDVAVEPFEVVVDDFEEIDSGGVNVFTMPWDFSIMLDLGPELDARGFDPNAVVSRGTLELRNTLIAFGEESSLAFIEKNSLSIKPNGEVPNGENMLDPQFIVPEPATAALALVAIALRRSRRRDG